MSSLLKLGCFFLLALTVSGQSMAAFMLSGTRFIYEEGKKNTSFDVTNQADETFGGQVWIDNTTQSAGTVFMVPAPPFFKVAPKEKQIIRIMKTDSVLPSNRESLFWLNVQEIPPKPKSAEANVLAVAVNTQVKLIYRPSSLKKGRNGAETKLRLIQKGGDTYLSNPTPYYFAVTGMKIDGKAVRLSDAVLKKISLLGPESEVLLGSQSVNGTVSVDAINDWGGTDSYSLK